MTKYIVLEDCTCEGSLHELSRYPRPGLVRRDLKKGDIVVLVRHWINMYGEYNNVSKGGVNYDIPPEKLREIINEN